MKGRGSRGWGLRGSRLRVEGRGPRVEGLGVEGFKVEGSGSRVESLGSRAGGCGLRAED